MSPAPHQYIERATGTVRTERLIADRWVRWVYSEAREHAPTLFHALTGPRLSSLLACLNYDLALDNLRRDPRRWADALGVDLTECTDDPATLASARRFFERRIRYWDVRPTPPQAYAVTAPADARLALGSLTETSSLFIKGKFFDVAELFGPAHADWARVFANADFAVFRLTPDKYHYNHTPVAGVVVDDYDVDGPHHACNPAATVALATPFSKNRRHVTVFDTASTDGTGVGRVAMIEVAALMIGVIEPAYSDIRYEAPRALKPGDRVARGQPKSLYRPGGSVDILLFERGRIAFDEDLRAYARRPDVASRFTAAWGRPVVEIDVRVRERIARRA